MKHTNKEKLEMTLLLLMLAIVISSVIFKFVIQSDSQTADISSTTSLNTESHSGQHSANSSSKTNKASSIETTHAPKPETIVFDPNTADAETLKKVGFAPWQIKAIMNYRAKGGAYHRKEDVKHIYGLTYGQWEHIEPLIRIGKENQYIADNEDLSYRNTNYRGDNSTAKANDDAHIGKDKEAHTGKIDEAHAGKIEAGQSSTKVSTTGIVKLHKGETIDINLNDTLQMQRIPGIASKRASKLSAYIYKLGGLASADQLNDDVLSDMPLDLADYISIDTSKIRKLRINKLNAKQLANHPYINWSQARQLTERIRMYGPIKDWSEIIFLSEFTDADKVRLEPYISFE